ncbi:MAG: hypothetical protein QOF00_4767, partial [Pseudonocardiales bacterium]|nr:hypothetical protein [Pseudonocardiales bacterium]
MRDRRAVVPAPVGCPGHWDSFAEDRSGLGSDELMTPPGHTLPGGTHGAVHEGDRLLDDGNV